jgi:hypothetical protein
MPGDGEGVVVIGPLSGSCLGGAPGRDTLGLPLFLNPLVTCRLGPCRLSPGEEVRLTECSGNRTVGRATRGMTGVGTYDAPIRWA